MRKLYFTFIVCLFFSGCNEDANNEKHTINLVSNDNKKYLFLTLKKCFFDMGKLENGPFSYVYLKFPLYTFSGNYTENYQCLKKSNELGAFLEISHFGNKLKKNSKDYLLKAYSINDKDLIEKSNNISIYKFGINKNVIVVEDNSNSHKINMFIFYVPYSSFLIGQKNGFTDRFNIISILDDDFKIEYDVYSSNFIDDNRKIYGIDVNADFIDDFREVVQGRRDILDKPEIIYKFVENNKRVISFIKANSHEELK